MIADYPHESWSAKESAWAVMALMEAGRKSESIESVFEQWIAKALNENDSNFVLHRLPSKQQLKAFSESLGSKMDLDLMTDSASATASASQMPDKKRRKKTRYHSNDEEKEDPGYLVFPLKLSDLDDQKKYKQRRKKAYCKALGVKGKATVLMGLLRTYVAACHRSGAARPEKAPGGLAWSDWSFEK